MTQENSSLGTYFDMLNTFIDIKDGLANNVKAHIADKNESLEQRWKLYEKACEAGLFGYEDYYPSMSSMDSVSWYDDFYIEKGQTAFWTDIIERIKESKGEGKRGQYFDNLDEIKEEVLSMGYAGFVFDW